MKATRNSFIARIAAFAVAFCMMAAMACTAFAIESNTAVTNDTSGVVQIKLIYTDDNNDPHTLKWGTGFLINNSTVITANHVVIPNETELNDMSQHYGKSLSEVKDRMSIKISVLRDLTVNASVRNASAEMDYAILDLSSQIYDRTYLSIRSSATLQQTEELYALGFPGDVEWFQDVSTYTSDDVTISNGKLSKMVTYEGVDLVQSSTKTTDGMSGGPVVDGNGNVIGIINGGVGDGLDVNYFYAIAIDQLTKALDALGVEYTNASTSAPAATQAPATSQEPAVSESTTPVAAPVETDKSQLNAVVTDAQKIEVKEYDEASGATFSSALVNAQNILANENATQQQIDAAATDLSTAQLSLVQAGGFPVWIIVVIAAAVVVVVVVAVVIVNSGKKKTAAVSASTPSYTPPAGFASASATPAQNFGQASAGETTVLSAGAGETTVLNAGAGETTLLNSNQSYGSIKRVKTGENIKINSASFLMGKEMSKVNYCISDNTSISRTHAKITIHSGAAFITDLGATNGTFVNGVKLDKQREFAIHDGDKFRLADEEFIYNAF